MSSSKNLILSPSKEARLKELKEYDNYNSKKQAFSIKIEKLFKKNKMGILELKSTTKI